ncbi:hypothetical protein ACHAXR_005459 [Thalassiosira sp. AJA248-18]
MAISWHPFVKRYEISAFNMNMNMANVWVALFATLIMNQLLGTDAFLSCTSCNTHHLSKPHVGCNIRNHCRPLMGIKGFRSWFETEFPSAVVTINPDRYKAKNGQFQPETFDHVLIDANQFLHSNLRKAFNRRTNRPPDGSNSISAQQLEDDIIEYSLLLFMKEINELTSNTAVPRKSLVIAIDGSPAAAKLDVQRGRRHSIYKKSETQNRQISFLRERGWRDNDFGYYSNKGGKKQINPLLSKHERERISMLITPGTTFMDRVTSMLLYWSWQYVSRFPRVRVYISPSHVHGEGEVKLLDWIMHGHVKSFSSPRSRRKHVNENDTVAILGGDSDLVLMGLVVPPSITHNLHVILPGDKSKSLVVSVWEATRRMARMIEGTEKYGSKARKTPKGKKKNVTLTPSQINQARIDTVLLIIMNSGNDYLPKLRGCRTGFDSFFTVYLDLVKTCLEKQNGSDELRPFLIISDENNQLYLNVPFARAFFQAMSTESQISWPVSDSSEDGSTSRAELGTLINLVEAKILPGPLEFSTISPEESFFQQELWEMNSKLNQNTSDVINEVFADGAEIVRLTLGNFPDNLVSLKRTATDSKRSHDEVSAGESDGHGIISRMRRSKDSTKAGGRAYLFEVPHRQYSSSIKATKYRLACLALEECFGRDNVDALFGDGDSDQNESGKETKDSMSVREMLPQGLADADAATFLGGLLWNLETYQHGCCVDYGFDHGRRASPTPFELVDFLANLEEQGMLQVKCVDLIGRSTTTPLNDGLSCLAAVPPQAHHIVPEPYSLLVDSSTGINFEDLYLSCFHNETSTFDMQSFEAKCEAELSKIRKQKNAVKDMPLKREKPMTKSEAGRHIYAGSNSWTVLSYSNKPLAHPFEPPAMVGQTLMYVLNEITPEPFTDRVRRLRQNKKIRASKLPVRDRVHIPRETSVNGKSSEKKGSEARGSGSDQKLQDRHNNMQSVHDVPYNTAFRK